MSQKPSQFKIGLFVLAALAMLLTALFAFGVRREFEKKQSFETYVLGDVDGLSVGADVKLKGVHVGEVTKMSFSWIEYPGGRPSCVVISFDVKASVNLAPAVVALDDAVRRGLRAIVKNQGLTGSAILSLEMVDPVKNPPLEYEWKPRSYVIPSAESQLSHIAASVEKTLANLEKLDVERLGAHLDHTLQLADDALRGLGQLDVKRLSQGLNEATSSTRAAALEVRALARDARGTLRGMQLEALGRDADRLVLGLQESNARASRLIERLSGIDVQDLNATLAGTRQAARHLDDAIEELRQYPSGFLLGKEPPPAQGIDKERR